MQRTWILISLVALTLGLLALVLLAPRPNGGPAAPGREEVRTYEPPPAALAGPAPRLAMEQPPRRPVDEKLPSTGAASEDQPDESLHGVWLVHDDAGAASAHEDGWFEYTLDGQEPVLRAAVLGGAWSLSCPRGTRLEPGRIELGGRGAVALDSAWEKLAEPDWESEIELEARWIRPTVIRVLDAASRIDLDGVEVRLGSGGADEMFPDAKDLQLCTGASSPIELPLPARLDEFENAERVWARARGYAWATLEVPRGLGGEFVLALEPGGTLHVEVTGFSARFQPFFRLRDPAVDRTSYKGVRISRRLVSDARFALESLAEGSYLATVEIGRIGRHPQVLESRELDLRGGFDEQVSFDLAWFEPPTLVEVHGELVVPTEWNFPNIGLYLELVGEPTLDGVIQRYLDGSRMKVLDADVARLAWSFGELQPGSYEARFYPLGHLFAFEVPAGGMSPLSLEVPPPPTVEATVDVIVVDEVSGQPVEDAAVFWISSRDKLEGAFTLNGAGRIEPGRFRMTAPVGDVELRCFSKSHHSQHPVVALVGGYQRVEVRTRRVEGITLRILDGEVALSLNDVEFAITEIDGDGEGWLKDDDNYSTVGRFVVSHPGLYRIEVTGIPEGYGPPPPAEVYVGEASFVRVELRATRR